MTFSTKKYEENMPAFCVWMHVLLIRVHRNWKLAKSLIGNDLAPTEDRSREAGSEQADVKALSLHPSTICCRDTTPRQSDIHYIHIL